VIVAVTGGRDFCNGALIESVLDALHFGSPTQNKTHIELLVHGGCVGVDTIAGLWAYTNCIQTCVFAITDVQWRMAGRGSGPYRNRQMLEVTRPNLLVAFPGGCGTANCVQIARGLGIEVLEVKQ
jgi:hypothetical protein